MTHGLGPGKPGPRAAKPITPPYVENNYRIEVEITFMLIAYLVLLCELFWEFSIFHFCRPLVHIYWHPLLIRFLQVVLSFARCLQESTKMFFPFRFLFTMSLNLSLGRPWFLFPSRNWEYNSCLGSPVKFVAIMESELAVSVKVRVRVRSPGSSPGFNLMLVYLL